jgi:hypothetical protein
MVNLGWAKPRQLFPIRPRSSVPSRKSVCPVKEGSGLPGWSWTLDLDLKTLRRPDLLPSTSFVYFTFKFCTTRRDTTSHTLSHSTLRAVIHCRVSSLAPEPDTVAGIVTLGDHLTFTLHNRCQPKTTLSRKLSPEDALPWRSLSVRPAIVQRPFTVLHAHAI